MTPSRAPLALLTALGLLAAAATSLVPPRGDGAEGAVIAVSRLGRGVRLLGPGWAFSAFALERRVRVAAEGGLAIVEAPLRGKSPAGADVPLVARLFLAGGGTLPLSAGPIRRDGWRGAWESWLAGTWRPLGTQVSSALSARTTWRETFPAGAPGKLAEPPGPPAPLQDAFRGPTLSRIELKIDGDDAALLPAIRAEMARRYPRKGRLVVLGLDALDWRLVDDLAARGLVPNLSALARRGVQAVVDVPPPLISPVVWTTIATGVPPTSHGILDFLEASPGGGPPRPVTGNSRRAAALWELMSAAGRSTSVVCWWATWPARPPEAGTVYADLLVDQLHGLRGGLPDLAAPAAAAAAARDLLVSPSSLAAKDLAPLAAVTDAEIAAGPKDKPEWDDPVGGLLRLTAATATIRRLTDREISRGTDALLVYLEGTDTVGHLFAAHRPPARPWVSPEAARRFSAVPDRYHADVDRWIGEIASRLGASDTLVVISDHGFTWGTDRPDYPVGSHDPSTVWHRPEGFFVAAGPGVVASPARRRIGILDVAPSLLALAGLPADRGMPGKVPSWLCAPESVPPALTYGAKPPAGGGAELPESAAREQVAKLRALGYLSGPSTAARAPGLQPAPAVPQARGRVEARQLTNRGLSLIGGPDPDAPAAAFRKAIEADPTFEPPWHDLLLETLKRGRWDEGEKLLWEATDHGVPGMETTAVQFAVEAEKAGRMEMAGRVLAEARRRWPSSVRR